MKGRAAPPKPNISERPAAWGPWEWRNHLTDPRAKVYREAPVSPTYPARMGLKRACLNLVYSVQFFERASEWGTIAHLLIRRHDQGLDFPWAELQRIKDELCGPECVAVEVFPPQSQLVDDANCRHLWVLPDGFTLPFGLHIEGWKHD
jgi:hypothetical protein